MPKRNGKSTMKDSSHSSSGNTRQSAVADQPESASTTGADECMYGDMSESLQQYYQKAEEVVQKHPATTVMAVFAAGLGVGAVAAGLLAGPPSKSQRMSRTAEDLGHRIYDAIKDALPSSLIS